MTFSSDSIGQWRYLGYVLTIKRQWVKIPTAATGGNATFRASFLCSDWAKLSSYLLLRPRYQVSGSPQLGAAVRVYPAPLPSIFEIAIPQEIKERGIIEREIEVLKVGRFRRGAGISPDANLEIRLDELWGQST